jgi:hypothetical protein
MLTYADVCCLAGFPADTLYRYHYFLRAEAELLSQTDVLYYMDVDLCIQAHIRAFEIAPFRDKPLVAVRHMLQDGRGTPESRPQVKKTKKINADAC